MAYEAAGHLARSSGDAPGATLASSQGATLLRLAETLAELSRILVSEAASGPRPVRQTSSPGPHTDPGFTYVHGLPEIGAAIQSVVDGARKEILTAQPDGPRPSAVLDKALDGVREQIDAGVFMRTLYQHSTRFDEPTKEYVRAVAGYGGQVRTLAEFFDRLIVVDQRTAFIPASADRTVVVVVTEPAVVRFLTDMFERAWDRAEPYPFLPVRAADAATEVVPDMREAICKLLIEGRSDREIARRLGLSLRTLQSHIARLKDAYSAQHRLQLGYLMARAEISEKPVETSQPL
ncbi:LuxR family transcriptional regulator [Streptomyces brevispora]|uniref:LuxR family transcriptional regulator n=1 Tax=Streptomyces brevispora TaxID=887462 RepID=UPI0033D590CC